MLEKEVIQGGTHDHYVQKSVDESVVKKRHIKYELKDVRFFNNSHPDKHYVSCEDGSEVCQGGMEYCKQVSYSPKSVQDIFNPDEKSQLATEVMTRDSKSRFLDMDILELKLDSSIVRMQDNPDEFYLTLSVSAVVLEKVE
jgi:hypothetical protein